MKDREIKIVIVLFTANRYKICFNQELSNISTSYNPFHLKRNGNTKAKGQVFRCGNGSVNNWRPYRKKGLWNLAHIYIVNSNVYHLVQEWRYSYLWSYPICVPTSFSCLFLRGTAVVGQIRSGRIVTNTDLFFVPSYMEHANKQSL
jgi:hypothetical protein